MNSEIVPDEIKATEHEIREKKLQLKEIHSHILLPPISLVTGNTPSPVENSNKPFPHSAPPSPVPVLASTAPHTPPGQQHMPHNMCLDRRNTPSLRFLGQSFAAAAVLVHCDTPSESHSVTD